MAPFAADTLIVWLPGDASETMNVSVTVSTTVARGNTACGSVLENTSVPEKLATGLPAASSAVTVRLMGVPPTIAAISARTEKCRAADGEVLDGVALGEAALAPATRACVPGPADMTSIATVAPTTRR
jgi:hypothetical protein